MIDFELYRYYTMKVLWLFGLFRNNTKGDIMNFISRLFVICCFFLITSVSSAATGGYLGVGLGSANTEDPQGGVDDSDTGIKIYGGFKYSENLGVEIFFADFGEPTTNISGFNVSTQISGLGVDVVGYVPLGGGGSLFGKFGLFTWDEDYTVNGIVVFTDNGADITYGLGYQFDFSPTASVRVEYEFFPVSDVAGDIDVDMISVGIQMNF